MAAYLVIALVSLAFFLLRIWKPAPRPHQPPPLSERRQQELARRLAERRQEVASDPDRLTAADLRAVLAALPLPPLVLALFDGTEKLTDYGFYDFFERPEHLIQMTRREQDQFAMSRYVPLFETGDDFGEVLAYDTVRGDYLRYHPESGAPNPSYPVLTWDGVFVGQMLTWYEDEKSDQQILHLCALLGLTHAPQVLASIPAELGSQYTSEAIAQWETRTLDRIRGRLP